MLINRDPEGFENEGIDVKVHERILKRREIKEIRKLAQTLEKFKEKMTKYGS